MTSILAVLERNFLSAVCEENVIELYTFGRSYSDALKSHALDFIRVHAAEIFDEEHAHWLKLSKEEVDSIVRNLSFSEGFYITLFNCSLLRSSP